VKGSKDNGDVGTNYRNDRRWRSRLPVPCASQATQDALRRMQISDIVSRESSPRADLTDHSGEPAKTYNLAMKLLLDADHISRSDGRCIRQRSRVSRLESAGTTG
jgi:hypothetical protein